MNDLVVSLRLTGARPIILHNGRLADPLDQSSKILSALTGKRKKTDADHQRISEAEFRGGLYVVAGKIVIPAQNLEACLIEGAKINRQGPEFKAGLIVPDDAILEYDGPPPGEMFAEGDKFVLRIGAKVGKARVMRTRPIVRQWALTVIAKYDREVLNPGQIIEAAQIAGRRCGLGTWRPRYGRFTVEVL